MRKITSIFISTMFTTLLLSACAPDAAAPTNTPLPPPPSDTPEPTFTPTPRPEGWVQIETAHMPPPRTHHAIALLPDGKLLLFGGEDPDGNALGDTWILDPGASAGLPAGKGPGLLRPIPRPLLEDWTQIDAPNAPDARFGHSMVTLGDGRVLLFGGENGAAHLFNDLHVFDGSAWNQVTPNNDPPAARSYSNVWAYNDTVYVQGGIGAENEQGKRPVYSDLWGLNPDTNNWEQLQSPPGFISNHAGAYLSPDTDQSLLVDSHTAAFEKSGKSYLYDYQKGEWDTFYMEGTLPGMPGYTDYSSMVQVNGALYQFGGYIHDPATGQSTITDQVWQFEYVVPEARMGAWTPRPDMTMPYPLAGAEAVYDPGPGRFIFIGGKTSDVSYLDRLLSFYPPALLPPDQP